MSSNLFKAFSRLVPGQPLLVGTVISTDGTSSVVELPGGARISVRGTRPPDQAVFVRGNLIEGDAPPLEVVIVTV